MYLDYESFIDCLVKSGYNKVSSDLVSETWVNGWYRNYGGWLYL